MSRRVPGLVRIKYFHVQIERPLVVVFIQPTNAALRRLFGNRLARFAPAFAISKILVYELPQRCGAMPVRCGFIDELEVVLRIDTAQVRLNARSLGIKINLLAANPFEVSEAAMQV